MNNKVFRWKKISALCAIALGITMGAQAQQTTASTKKPVKKTATVTDTAKTKQTILTEQMPLDEMAVMDMTSQGNRAAASSNSAHPQTGWNSFKNYLKEKAISPDGKTGTVKLAFLVSSEGELSGFKIKQGLTEAADKKAIELIKNGPSWVESTDGSETVISIDFH